MQQFSPPHLAALAVAVVLCGLAVWAARRHGGRWETPAAWALAALVFAAWAGEYVADAIDGIWSVQYTLPLQLTDAVSIATVLALLTRRMLFVEMAYLWAMSASLQATLTPDLAYTFPSIFYFTYFTYHVGAIVAAVYLVFGAGLVPRRGAVRRVYAVTAVWTAIAGLGDVITGGNYMYLREKPVHNSLLNVMGPWPWYIVSGALLGLALMVAFQALAATQRSRAGGGFSSAWSRSDSSRAIVGGPSSSTTTHAPGQ